jgi:hypothetical protein
MAFHHVVLFQWQPGTTDAQVDEVTAALTALSKTLRGVRSYSCGRGLGLFPFSSDYGVVAAFDDRAAWDEYMANTEHDRIRADLI